MLCEQAALVDAINRLELSQPSWQYLITDLVARTWGDPVGSLAVDATDPCRLICESAMVRTDHEVAISDARVTVELEGPEVSHALFGRGPRLARLANLLGGGFAQLDDYARIVGALPSEVALDFAVALRTITPRREGLLLMLPMRPAMVRSKASWEYVATHLELACELRSALAGRIAHSTGSQPPAYLRQTQKGVAIDCVFFGIGSTLGTVRRPPLSLTHHAEIPRLLQSLRALGLRIGIISNVPAEVSRGEIVAMLEAAGLYDAFDEGLVVLSSDRAKTEPEHQIYRDALERAGVAAEECLFIGDNPAEVIGAQAAGMSAHLRALPAASLAPL